MQSGLEHNGDFKAAAKALAAQGYGTPTMKAAPSAQDVNYSREAKQTEDAAAIMDDVILLVLNHYPEHFNEENKITLLALFAVFGGRSVAAISHSALASRIRKREGTEAGKKADGQFGARRLTKLRKALRRSINYEVLKMIQHSSSRGKSKNGKNLPSKYKLDMRPFRQALILSKRIYKQWCAGKPRLPEWKDENGDPRTPNPARCRELAAQIVADYYRKDAAEVRKEEAAELLRVEVKTIRAWVSQDRIPYRKANGRVIFMLAELLTWTLPENGKHTRHRLAASTQVKIASSRLAATWERKR